MAATWIKPIRVNKGKSIASTLAKRTDYVQNHDKTVDRTVSKIASVTDHGASISDRPIEKIIFDSADYARNPDKTGAGELVRGFECDSRTADEEFLLAKKEYDYLTGRNNGDKNVLAYHIRQSFKPGEIEPQEALDVGYDLALRWTRGKHAFIVAVHTDKAHIHCHIIYNSTTIDCRHKYKNFLYSSYALRRLSDMICLERGLSVIEEPRPSKGKNYAEWLGDKEPSWKEKLRKKVDEILPDCASFEDFVAMMKSDGYTVDDGRKHITFTAPGQKKPTRLKSLGDEYTEAAIRERIACTKGLSAADSGGAHVRYTDGSSAPHASHKNTHIRVNLLIDIQAKIQEGKGAGYEHWARIFNIKESARTLLFLKDNGIDSYDDLVVKTSLASADFSELNKKIKAAEGRMKEISELQKQIGTYGKTREVYARYKKSGWNSDFYEKHRADITLHRAAKKHFDNLGIEKLPPIASLKQEYAALLADKKKLYAGYHSSKKNMQELLVARGNAERLLGIKPEAQNLDVPRFATRSEAQQL